jgi:hypothetical protein
MKSLSSTPIRFRPIFWATARIVPEPARQSRAVSPGAVAAAMSRSGFEYPDRSRCLLANFEFHHVVLNNAQSGRIDFTGVLVGAVAYRQDVYDRIAADTFCWRSPRSVAGGMKGSGTSWPR